MELNIELTSDEREVLEIALMDFKGNVEYLYETCRNDSNEKYYNAINSLIKKI